MSFKIKERVRLPKWFSLDKYKHVSGFGILEWRNELVLRAILLKYLGVRDFDFLAGSKLIGYVSESEFEVCLDVSRRVVKGSFSPRSISEISPLGAAKMKDLRFQAYLDRAAFERGSASQDLVMRWGMVRPVVYLEKDFLSSMELSVSVEHEKEVVFPYLLKVNLGAPDSVLIKAFSDWLSWVRKDGGRGEVEVVKSLNTGTKMYRLWKDYGVLPYLDLVIWAAHEGLTLSKDFLAEAVLPYKSSGLVFMAEKTIPKAYELMQGLDSIELTCFYEMHASGQSGIQ